MATNSWASIGQVVDQTGPAVIERDKDVIPSKVDTGVEMNDNVVTQQGRVGILFEDATRVQVTEQSKLLIDEFVYDPKHSDAGKLTIKVLEGTARYASGQIAKNNPQSVKITTPTATIAVRGTDFSMTVDEMGRSLIILLPSCPTNWRDIERDCKTGKIDVTTDMGTVHLSKPFQSTVTTSVEKNPTRPTILKLSEAQINNLLIVTRKKFDEEEESRRNGLLRNALDMDLLRFTDLDVNFLSEVMDALSKDNLAQNFLFDYLDFSNSELLENLLKSDEGMLPKYDKNKAAGLNYYTDDSWITLYRETPSNSLQVTLDKTADTNLTFIQDGITLNQIVNHDGGTNITITQSD